MAFNPNIIDDLSLAENRNLFEIEVLERDALRHISFGKSFG